MTGEISIKTVFDREKLLDIDAVVNLEIKVSLLNLIVSCYYDIRFITI